ncbi:MAG: dienelactone hydrolase family protein [Cyanobacteria bacterium]|nr:dienelactone hydrolase family protein [Cyanobacteriota bacterium]
MANVLPNDALPQDGLPEDDGQSIRLGPAQPQRRLVLLHGWGADADDLLDLGTALLAEDGQADEVSVVALRAPEPHPGGFGRQWYDLQQPNWPGLGAARTNLRQRLAELAETVPLERTAVLGFSQGAAMAVDVILGEGLPVAALIACSGYPHPGWQAQSPKANTMLTHGDQDPVVPAAASQAIGDLVQQAGGQVERISFSGVHGIDPQLLPELRAFLARHWT